MKYYKIYAIWAEELVENQYDTVLQRNYSACNPANIETSRHFLNETGNFLPIASRIIKKKQ